MSFVRDITQEELINSKKHKPVLDIAIAGDLYFEIDSPTVYKLDHPSQSYLVREYHRYKFFRLITHTEKGNKII